MADLNFRGILTAVWWVMGVVLFVVLLWLVLGWEADVTMTATSILPAHESILLPAAETGLQVR
jgi:hypothetical protein